MCTLKIGALEIFWVYGVAYFYTHTHTSILIHVLCCLTVGMVITIGNNQQQGPGGQRCGSNVTVKGI